jgi:GTP cyclohydrolase I
MTLRAAVAIGSNVEPYANVPRALALLSRHPDLTVERVGGVYETAPVGRRPDDPRFLNAAALVSTPLDPAALRSALRAIEAVMGRARSADKNAPRVIDLDVVMIEGWEGDLEGSPIPDPEISRRSHLAVPLADVVGDWEFPGIGKTVGEIAVSMKTTEEEIRLIVTSEFQPMRTDTHYADESRMEELSPTEVYDKEMETTVRGMLAHLGEDPEREGLLRTPLRVAKAMDFLTSGYTTTIEEVVNNAVFESDADEMVLVKEIEFYSMCEHHMLPFFGKAHVAYLPKGKIIGVSKIARIIDVFARRLQVQERLTNQIAIALEEVLDPHGVAVVMEGSHFCMMMRGVQKQGSLMVTSAMRGTFKRDAATRGEFMELIRSS